MVNLGLIDFALVVQIFVLINPLSSLPVLMSAYKNKLNVRKISISAVILAGIIAVTIALIGPFLFNLFKITLDSFRIAGGLVLLLLGLDTIRKRDLEEKKDIGKIDSLVSVIATPLLTGPATISFITIKAFEIGKTAIILDIFVTFILVAIVFVLISMMIPKINLKVVDLMSKVLGLFLTAVAIEMIAKGISNLFFIAK